MCACLWYRRLTVKHKRTLQLEEDVLCVKFSPDHRLLAVSLLDCTVKIFYTDTLKVRSTYKIRLKFIFTAHCLHHIYTFFLLLLQFFLSLYGHKLPVLCLDISHVSTVDILKLLAGLRLKNNHFSPRSSWLWPRVSLNQDSSIIATGSADRNVKIWGLDFGDCHRSMFAHDDRYCPAQTQTKQSEVQLEIRVFYSVMKSSTGQFSFQPWLHLCG